MCMSDLLLDYTRFLTAAGSIRLITGRVMIFADRRDAGRQLAIAVRDRLGDAKDAIVLALPRGGVVVAEEVARLLGCPLDVVVVRKIGAPGI